MKIIISPTKKMKEDFKSLPATSSPAFINEAEIIKSEVQKLSYDQAQKLWKTNDKLTDENFHRFSNMDLTKGLTPAILAYEGIAFKYMAPAVFEDKMLNYVQNNLYILSAMYGALKPIDGITPYRLEMQAPLQVDNFSNLYDFWGDKLYNHVIDESKTIINLASKEYSKVITKYKKKDDVIIDIVFGQISNGKVVQKGTYAKMARGEMVRFMAKNNVTNVEEIKKFNLLNYTFNSDFSTDTKLAFINK